MSAAAPPGGARVLLLGATGTIGRATAAALRRRGHAVVAFGRRPGPGPGAVSSGIEWRRGDVADAASVARDGLRGERFDAVVSCLASRTGAPADAWAIDHRAHLAVLQAVQDAGVGHFVLLSAICVQKPLLAFQQAKLAFEAALTGSGIGHSIVRPTAFFKSLSGQIDRVARGQPFMVFGDGLLTACKPIGDDDLGDYLARCVDDRALHGRILPIGGPGPALTPRAQGELLCRLAGRPARFRHVPVALLDGIVGTLSVLGRVSARAAAKAELARIGRYYATESMLVLDPASGRYDAEATPEFGRQTLEDHYARRLRGELADDRGEHAVF